ncbi:MAG: hypothetical protein IT238_10040 [Bacteroidia bacterium]|nr:hypothetical protein [Bacteroidia bacterium]MCZ2247927.1 hypothetical protein [Bacteroidia bacterium]
MKKIITILLLAMIGNVSFAQVKTTYYPSGKKQSEGVLLNADASVLSSDFEKLPKEEQFNKMKNCPKDGKWTMWYEDGKVFSEQYYKNGAFVGIWKTYNTDGSVSNVIDFEKGKASYFHPNGKLQSEGKITKEMAQVGHWVLYYDNGMKNAEGNYINGKKDGAWVWYNMKGEKTDEQVYKDGSIVSQKHF